MQVEIVRRGGLPGVAVRGTVDTADLPAGEQAAVEAALRGLPFGRPPPLGQPERFQYEVTVKNGGAPRSAVLNEAEVPATLSPVFNAAVARGEIL